MERSSYFVPRMGALDGVYSGAWAGSISWNCGSERSFGGLLSLVQQHAADARAKAAVARDVMRRIMVIRMWLLEKESQFGVDA